MIIEIVPAQATWPEEYRGFAQILRAALGPLALRIDHIGSTAVPGLVAKDIIDIQVTVAPFTDGLDAAILPLGYTRIGGIWHDHAPPGSAITEAEQPKQMYKSVPPMRPINLHVRLAGSFNQRYPILFRDYLRGHPLASAAYGAIKQQLARHAPHDQEYYYDIKDPVCDLIWLAAEDWARETDWEQGATE